MEDKSHCRICGKLKEKKHIKYVNIDVYIECDCERKLREEKEQADYEYAKETAIRLRNINSRLSNLGQKASFKTAKVDKYNEVAVRGGKYLLNQLLKQGGTESKNSLVLQGNRGSGKTYIACAIINDFNERYPVHEAYINQILKERKNLCYEKYFSPVKSPCKFITEMDLYVLFYEDYNYCKTESLLDEMKKAEKLLVIDDVGASNYDKNRLQTMYLNIIDYRYSQGLPLMLTTNLTKAELSDYIGDRCFDRLRSCSYFVDIVSPESRRG